MRDNHMLTHKKVTDVMIEEIDEMGDDNLAELVEEEVV